MALPGRLTMIRNKQITNNQKNGGNDYGVFDFEHWREDAA